MVAWRSRTATRKMEGRITRRAVEAIRRDLEDSDLPPLEPKENESLVTKSRQYHFDNKDIAMAVKNMEAVKSRVSSEQKSLQTLTRQTWLHRRPRYASAILPDALQAVRRASCEIEDYIKILNNDKVKLRDVRKQIRWLLDIGRTSVAVMEQARKAPRGFLDNAAIFSYLILHKRLLRLSIIIMDGLSRSTSPRDFGSAFLMLVKEAMAPYEEPGVLDRQKKETWAAKFMKLLSNSWHGKSLDLPPQAMYMLAGELPQEQVLDAYHILQKVAPDKIGFNL